MSGLSLSAENHRRTEAFYHGQPLAQPPFPAFDPFDKIENVLFDPKSLVVRQFLPPVLTTDMIDRQLHTAIVMCMCIPFHKRTTENSKVLVKELGRTPRLGPISMMQTKKKGQMPKPTAYVSLPSIMLCAAHSQIDLATTSNAISSPPRQGIPGLQRPLNPIMLCQAHQGLGLWNIAKGGGPLETFFWTLQGAPRAVGQWSPFSAIPLYQRVWWAHQGILPQY